MDCATSECSTSAGCNGDAQDCDDILSTCSSSPLVDTFFIFDWDDTLFPTTWLQQHGLFSCEMALTFEQQVQLEKMAQCVQSTLQQATQMGKVVVITNAERGWIERSCTKFMPSLVECLRSIDIISARAEHEFSSRSPAEWKRLAFELEIECFYDMSQAGEYRNIISVGDSQHEVDALNSVANSFPKCFGKSIKLLELPSIEQLMHQHEFLLTCLLDVAEHNGALDVEIGADDVA